MDYDITELKKKNPQELSLEEFMAIKDSMDKAEEDTTPYAAVSEGQIHIVGDPNKTEVKKEDFVIQFAYPNTEFWRKQIDEKEIFNETPNYIGVEKHFKDVWVSPRLQTAIMTAFVELYAFFTTTMENGEVRDMTLDEIKIALRELNQEMVEAMCHAVGTILKIPPREEDFMLTTSTAVCLIKIVEAFPEVINGMDFFTEQ